jgi:hypothetical protein
MVGSCPFSRHGSLLLFLLLLIFLLEVVADAVLELLPRVAVQTVAELAVVVHLSPAIAAPLATGHVHQKVPVLLRVVNVRVIALLAARARRKAHDLSLLDEGDVRPDPGLVLVHVLERVLLLVLPLHVLLLVADGVPPDVEQPVCPHTSPYHERAEVEAAAVLRYDHVDRVNIAVADWRSRFRVEVFVGQGVRDVEGVVLVDIAVCDLIEALEDVLL